MPSTSRTLSEAASKALLATYGVPMVDEREVTDPESAVGAAEALGYPVVVKLCGDGIAHKTERGLVRLALPDAAAVRTAAGELLAAADPGDGAVSLLVARMVRGTRELIAGLVHDPQFGMNVMVGLGGVLAEAISDVVFCPAPITPVDAEEMLEALAVQAVLGPFRGEPAVDRQALAKVLLGLSALAGDRPDVLSADVNPLIVVDSQPIAVDALVELAA